MNGSADTFWQAVRAKGIARQNANSGRNCQKTDLAKTRQGSEQCLTETRHMETIFDRSVLSYGQAAKDVLLSLRTFVCKAWTAYAKTLQHLPSSATPRNCCLAIAKWHPRDCATVCSLSLERQAYGNDGSPKFRKAIDAPQNIGGCNRFREIVVLAAVSARQVAPADRHDMRHNRVRARFHGLRDNLSLTQMEAGCVQFTSNANYTHIPQPLWPTIPAAAALPWFQYRERRNKK